MLFIIAELFIFMAAVYRALFTQGIKESIEKTIQFDEVRFFLMATLVF